MTLFFYLKVFYLAVLAVGIWAGWKQRREARNAGRDIGNQGRLTSQYEMNRLRSINRRVLFVTVKGVF